MAGGRGGCYWFVGYRVFYLFVVVFFLSYCRAELERWPLAALGWVGGGAVAATGSAAPPRNWLKPFFRGLSSPQAHLCAAQMCNHKTSWHLHGAPQGRISKRCVCAGGRPRAPLSFVCEGWALLLPEPGIAWGAAPTCGPLTTGEYSLRGSCSSQQERTWLPCHLQGVSLGIAAVGRQCATAPFYRVGRDVVTLLNSGGKPALESWAVWVSWILG